MAFKEFLAFCVNVLEPLLVLFLELYRVLLCCTECACLSGRPQVIQLRSCREYPVFFLVSLPRLLHTANLMLGPLVSHCESSRPLLDLTSTLPEVWQ